MKQALPMLLTGLGPPDATPVTIPAFADAQGPVSHGASPPWKRTVWTNSDRMLEEFEFRRMQPGRFCGMAKTSRRVGAGAAHERFAYRQVRRTNSHQGCAIRVRSPTCALMDSPIRILKRYRSRLEPGKPSAPAAAKPARLRIVEATAR